MFHDRAAHELAPAATQDDPGWCADFERSVYGADEPYRTVGSAGTLNVTLPEGEWHPSPRPIGFIWPA